MSDDRAIAEALDRARALAARGDDAAQAAYLDILRRDPTHFDALNELGNLAYRTRHRAAARTAYEQAIRHYPDRPLVRVNLGNLLMESGDVTTARVQYETALAADPDFAPAHQGLARALTELGEHAAAELHWQKGFAGHAILRQPYRGTASPVPVLLLASAKGGNIPTQNFLDDRIFEITVLYAEFYDPTQPLPSHVLVFNAIGDADLCGEALARAADIVVRTKAPIVNPPARVATPGRVANAHRLAPIAGVRAPAIRQVARVALQAAPDFPYPLLLRAPGYHTGQHFVRVERPEDFAAAAANLPSDELLAIEYLDARGGDGMARKYRVMIIDGVLYPLHLAISRDWKVHYFSAAMADDAAYRVEERRFLENMPAVLGKRALAALSAIGRELGLDYAGVDFALAPDGSVLLFEANATMVINPPEPDPIWDYRRAPIDRALDAAQRLLMSRVKR